MAGFVGLDDVCAGMPLLCWHVHPVAKKPGHASAWQNASPQHPTLHLWRRDTSMCACAPNPCILTLSFLFASSGKADSIECLAQGVTFYAQHLSLAHASAVNSKGEACFALSALQRDFDILVLRVKVFVSLSKRETFGLCLCQSIQRVLKPITIVVPFCHTDDHAKLCSLYFFSSIHASCKVTSHPTLFK